MQPLILDDFKKYLKLPSCKIPDNTSTDNLVGFIEGHQWTTMSTETTQLFRTLTQGRVHRNSPLVPHFNQVASENDGYQLQRFIHENLAKETKIVIHMIDGIHWVATLDCALAGFDQDCSEGTGGQALPLDIIEYARILPHKDKVMNLHVCFLQGGDNWSSELQRYQQLSYQI